MGILSRLKLNKTAFFIALIHWLISFASDRLVFTYHLFMFSDFKNIVKSVMAWGAKLAFLILLIVLWQLFIYFISEIKNGNTMFKRYAKYTFIYLIIMLLLLVFLFPGLWRMDEFGILRNAVNIIPHFWQGYLTSVFYIFALMLIPNPVGIIIVQVVIISLIVGYIIAKYSDKIQNKGLTYLLYIPFLLFPVIDSNFYPIRMSLYAFLELLYAFELVSLKYEKREIKKKNIWLLASLAGIIICWRTEAIYYIILAPVTFVILFYQETNKKIKLQFLLITVAIATILTSVQLMGNKLDSGHEYELTSIVLPITPLVYTAYENGDEEIINTIDQVFDTNVLIKGYQEGKSGIEMYWSASETNLKRDYTSKDFSNLKKAYYQLILKYPAVFLNERLETFLGSTGVLNQTETLFDEDTEIYYIDFREAYHYKGAPIRSQLIQLLEFINNRSLHNAIYSFLPQVILLFGTCLILLIRKKWGYFFICGTICAKIPLIFLTAPSKLFMYYYSIYLIGAVWLGMIVVFIINRRLSLEK